jgi:hypothetical protein
MQLHHGEVARLKPVRDHDVGRGSAKRSSWFTECTRNLYINVSWMLSCISRISQSIKIQSIQSSPPGTQHLQCNKTAELFFSLSFFLGCVVSLVAVQYDRFIVCYYYYINSVSSSIIIHHHLALLIVNQ